MYTRRELGKIALASVPAASALAPSAMAIDSKVNGVWIGAQTYSFRDRPVDACIDGCKEVGIGVVELWQGHVEPKMQGAALSKWRLETSMDSVKEVRGKFEKAGIKIYAYNYSFRENFTDEEIKKGFEFAEALGVKYITASSNVTTAKRIDPHAQKAKITVGMHNHSRIHENEFARPEDFFNAMKGQSKYIAINLDIGHFTAANFDPIDFLEKNHKRIVTLHIKDRKKNQGDNVVFGEGDTKIKEVLNVLKTKKYPIPANIEYEYKGKDTLEEVKRCFDYCKSAVA